MKKIINIVLLLNIVLGTVFATGCDKVEAPQKKFFTERFFIQSKTDGGLLGKSIESHTHAPNGYTIDDKFNVGDIVEVSYYNDDIISEKKLTGNKLENVKEKFALQINSLMDEGIELDYQRKTNLLK